MFRMILKINSDYFRKQHILIDLLMESHFFCEVGNGVERVIYNNFLASIRQLLLEPTDRNC
jgi:hypothetical protein